MKRKLLISEKQRLQQEKIKHHDNRNRWRNISAFEKYYIRNILTSRLLIPDWFSNSAKGKSRDMLQIFGMKPILNDIIRIIVEFLVQRTPKLLKRKLENAKNQVRLKLSNHGIEEFGTFAISAFLTKNSILESLNLSHNMFGDKGASAIMEALKANTILKLKILNLSHNKIGDKGAAAIMEALKVNTILKLKSLNLSHTMIGDKGAAAIMETLKENTILKKVDLRGNKFISSNTAKVFASAVVHSRSIKSFSKIHLNQFKSGHIICPIWKRQNELNFEYKSFCDLECIVIANLVECYSSLIKLKLGHNQFGNEGINALAKGLTHNNTLTYLNLSSNNIGDEGAITIFEMLKKNSTLKKIFLEECNIGDIGLSDIDDVLKINSNLEYLYLRGNQFGESSGLALGKILTNKHTLKDLQINGNRISNIGIRAIAESLRFNKGLTQLKMGCIQRQFSDDIARVITEALKTNTTLYKCSIVSKRISLSLKEIFRTTEVMYCVHTIHQQANVYNESVSWSFGQRMIRHARH